MRDRFGEMWAALGGATKATIVLGAILCLGLAIIHPCGNGISTEERVRVNAERKVNP